MRSTRYGMVTRALRVLRNKTSQRSLFGVSAAASLLLVSCSGLAVPVSAQTYTLTTLASFNGPNGYEPYGALTADSSGDLFGTTYAGGTGGSGTVYEVVKGSGVSTTLANFNNANGNVPFGGLTMDGNGNFFGTTYQGGANGYGTAFEIAKTGNTYGPVTTLLNFDAANQYPRAGLTLDSSGDLYGTTLEGGSGGAGTVFEITNTSGSASNPIYASSATTLAAFNYTNGGLPSANVILDSSGDIFGTTYQGGASGDGTVFEIKNGVLSTVAAFTGANGQFPFAGLTFDRNGNLFGTTSTSGPGGAGTVFELANTSGNAANPNYTGSVTTLASFDDTNGNGPFSDLIIDSKGDIYGTTSTGAGTVFEIANVGPIGSPSYATPKTLYAFNSNDDDGFEPYGGVIMDSSGNLYGANVQGGAGSDGTVYELSPVGAASASEPGALALLLTSLTPAILSVRRPIAQRNFTRRF